MRVLLFALFVQQAAVITVKLRFQGGDIAFRQQGKRQGQQGCLNALVQSGGFGFTLFDLGNQFFGMLRAARTPQPRLQVVLPGFGFLLLPLPLLQGFGVARQFFGGRLKTAFGFGKLLFLPAARLFAV